MSRFPALISWLIISSFAACMLGPGQEAWEAFQFENEWDEPIRPSFRSLVIPPGRPMDFPFQNVVERIQSSCDNRIALIFDPALLLLGSEITLEYWYLTLSARINGSDIKYGVAQPQDNRNYLFF